MIAGAGGGAGRASSAAFTSAAASVRLAPSAIARAACSVSRLTSRANAALTMATSPDCAPNIRTPSTPSDPLCSRKATTVEWPLVIAMSIARLL